MVCIHGIVVIALVAGVQSPFTPSIGAEMLQASMTEEEKRLFVDWYQETVHNESQMIQITILETVFAKPNSKMIDLLSVVADRHPGHTESLASIKRRYAAATWGGIVPLWFHETLSLWRGVLDPPSEPLVQRLIDRAHQFGPSFFSHRESLLEAIAIWNALCIVPARLGGPEIPCKRRDVPVRDRVRSVMSLRPVKIKALVGERLTLARAQIHTV